MVSGSRTEILRRGGPWSLVSGLLCWCTQLSAGLLEVEVGRFIFGTQGAEGGFVLSDSPFGGRFSVRTASPGDAVAAFMTFPYQQGAQLAFDGASWTFEGSYLGPGTLFSAFREGVYSLSLQRADTAYTTASYAAIGQTEVDRLPPESPVLANYSALQRLVRGSAARIEWRAWEQPGPSSVILVEVVRFHAGDQRVVYRSPLRGPEALPASSTFLILPADLFSAPGRYALRVAFTRIGGVASGISAESPEAVGLTTHASVTEVELGFTDDPPLSASVSWRLEMEPFWNTSRGFFLSPQEQFPTSLTADLVFAPGEPIQVPAAHVLATGPVGSGFDAAPGSTVSSDSQDFAAYGIRLQGIDFPSPGAYSVRYRARDFPFLLSSPPSPASTPVPFPTATLDADGRLVRVDWRFRDWSTGAAREPAPGISRQTLVLLDRNEGFLQRFDLQSSAIRSASVGPDPISWDSVARMDFILVLASGDRAAFRYRIGHLTDPAEVYFNEAVPDGGDYRAPWFGRFNTRFWPWILHERHGWLYAAGDGGPRLLLYDTRLGWLHTNQAIHPWFYSFSRGDWLYIPETRPAPQRWIWSHAGQRWFGG